MATLPPRLPDWPERLSDAVEAARGRPFSWGTHDCALFAADCARAITGHDPLAAVRGTYGTAQGAARVLRRLGGDDLGALAALVGGPAIPVAWARRGDWVLIEEMPEKALGVCLGLNAAFVTERGLTFRPTARCAAAWKIGA
ncbi:MAG: hypothetical protein AB7P52_11585 [Alphaproteobacteria bacterium]